MPESLVYLVGQTLQQDGECFLWRKIGIFLDKPLSQAYLERFPHSWIMECPVGTLFPRFGEMCLSKKSAETEKHAPSN